MTSNKRFLSLIAATLCLLLVTAAAPIEPLATTVIDILSSSPDHTVLIRLLQRCKLVPKLNMMRGVTLFAPTDEAWQRWARESGGDEDEDSDQKQVKMFINNLSYDNFSHNIDDDDNDIDDDDSELADNVLTKTHQLLLYHILNYTLPFESDTSSSSSFEVLRSEQAFDLMADSPDSRYSHEALDSHHSDSRDKEDRWIINNVSTETTILFPLPPSSHLARPHSHSPSTFQETPSDAPLDLSSPAHSAPPRSPLGHSSQKLRLLFDPPAHGPARVGVDHLGHGGVGVWTGWASDLDQAQAQAQAYGNRAMEKEHKRNGTRMRRSSDGVVIALDGVLRVPKSIGQQIDRIHQLGRFRSLFSLPTSSPPSMTTLVPDLYNDPHLTIFAPPNSAFEQTFDELEMSYLWGPWGGEGRERVLGGHAALDVKRGRKDGPVVGWRSNVSLKGGTLFRTIDNGTISMERNETGHLTANGTKVITPDIFAENGVIHLTSHLILPPRFKLLDDPGKVMLALNASRFVGLLEKTGLAQEYITKRREGGWTFLVPTDEVLEDARRDISGAADDSEDELEEMLRYHILPGRFQPKDLTDGTLAETELVTSLLKGNRQRVRVHVDRDTEDGGVSDLRFGAAAVVGEPYYGDDYMIYLVSTLNDPPTDVIQTAVSDLNLSTFVASLFAAGLNRLVHKSAGVTWLAPTNQAFSDLGLGGRYLLGPGGKDDLRRVVRYHALDGLVYNTDMVPGSTSIRTMTGDDIYLNVTEGVNVTSYEITGPYTNTSGTMLPINGARPSRILGNDLLTRTGTIHAIDAVQIPPAVDLTFGKLLHGAGCSTLIDLLIRADMEWVLTGGEPAKNVTFEYPYTILAPTDEAFSRLNLTLYQNDRDALVSLLKLHIVTSGPNVDSGMTTSSFKAKASFPLLLLDESIYSTLRSSRKYGDVIFRNDGHGSWLVGVNAARGVGQQSNAARVVEAGRASPNWTHIGDRYETVQWDSERQPWVGGQSLGGGVVLIDRVLVPYEPGWFDDWGYLALLAGAFGLVVISIAVYGLVWWRRRQRRIKLEEEDCQSGLEGEDDDDESHA